MDLSGATREKFLLFSLTLYAAALPLSMSATNIALGLLLAVSLYAHGREFRLRGSAAVSGLFPKSFLFLCLFFLWAAATAWLSEGVFEIGRLNSFSKIWNFVPYLAVPLAWRAFTEKTARASLKAFTAAAAAVAFLGAVQYATGIHYFFEGWFGSDALVIEKRFYGFQSYPLHTGALYCVAALCALSAALFAARTLLEKAAWFSGFLLTALGVFLTGSRSYYLALVLGVSFLFAVKGWKSLILGFGMGAVMLALLVSVNPYVRERVRTISVRHTDESGRQRLYMWQSALLMMRSHPVAGVGYKKWREHIPGYKSVFPSLLIEEATLGHAHNTYLTVGSETGLVGLGLFLSFWIFLLREQAALCFASVRAGWGRALSLAGAAAILSLMLAGFFEHNLLTATVCLSLFFVIGLSRASALAEGGPA